MLIEGSSFGVETKTQMCISAGGRREEEEGVAGREEEGGEQRISFQAEGREC